MSHENHTALQRSASHRRKPQRIPPHWQQNAFRPQAGTDAIPYYSFKPIHGLACWSLSIELHLGDAQGPELWQFLRCVWDAFGMCFTCLGDGSNWKFSSMPKPWVYCKFSYHAQHHSLTPPPLQCYQPTREVRTNARSQGRHGMPCVRSLVGPDTFSGIHMMRKGQGDVKHRPNPSYLFLLETRRHVIERMNDCDTSNRRLEWTGSGIKRFANLDVSFPSTIEVKVLQFRLRLFGLASAWVKGIGPSTHYCVF